MGCLDIVYVHVLINISIYYICNRYCGISQVNCGMCVKIMKVVQILKLKSKIQIIVSICITNAC